MAFDLEEQEQIANLKAWWTSVGRWVAVVAAVILLGYFSYRMFGKYQDSVAGKASQVYETLIVAAANKDLPKVEKVAQQIQTDYSSTVYAGMAGLVSANLLADTGNVDGAIKQLRWVEDKASTEGMRNIARSRLVLSLLDKGNADAINEADQLLKKSAAPGFEALILERRGDWYLVQSKKDDALKSYREAWDVLSKAKAKAYGQKEVDPVIRDLEKRNPDETQRLLKVKIDSLGGF